MLSLSKNDNSKGCVADTLASCGLRLLHSINWDVEIGISPLLAIHTIRASNVSQADLCAIRKITISTDVAELLLSFSTVLARQ